MRLIDSLIRPLVLVIFGAPLATCLAADQLVPEVYRDDGLAISAGVTMNDSHIIHLGDVISLVVVISWNSEKVSLEPPGEQLLPNVWPGNFVPVIVGVEQTHNAAGGAYTDQLQYVFRFQILDCPDAKLTCPNDRQYTLPELSLVYHVSHKPEPVTKLFRAEPTVLTIVSTIAHDTEGGLYPFSTYFPFGAYPPPLAVADGTRGSLVILGIGTMLLIGGTLMWPFRLRNKKGLVAKGRPRWEALLLELENEQEDDERRLADRMRRCLVWYCRDSLNLDPFDWVLSVEATQEGENTGLRELFIDLLRDPTGKASDLRNRLKILVESSA